jgi:putative redox protein
MITATNDTPRYLTRFSDGPHQGKADTTPDQGGQNAGFRPHALLEAALASCVNMTVQIYAEHHGLALSNVTTRVELDRRDPRETVFRYEIEVHGKLTPEETERLKRAGNACAVRRTLSKAIRFEPGTVSAGG